MSPSSSNSGGQGSPSCWTPLELTPVLPRSQHRAHPLPLTPRLWEGGDRGVADTDLPGEGPSPAGPSSSSPQSPVASRYIFLHYSENQLFSAPIPSRVFSLSEPNLHVARAEVAAPFSERCGICFCYRLPLPHRAGSGGAGRYGGTAPLPPPRGGASAPNEVRFYFRVCLPEEALGLR